MLESQIQISIMKWLKLNGYLTCRNMTVTPSGWPDITVIDQGGVHTYFEIKNETGRVSSIQDYMHDKLGQYNCRVHVVRSLQEVKGILNEEN